MTQDAEPTERKPSAIDRTIRDIVRNTKYFKAVADGTGNNKSTPEYQAHQDHLIATAIGSAVGLGKLYRTKEAATDASPADQMKALRSDARWIAAAAAENLGIDKKSDAYQTLSDGIVDAAICTAVAHDRLKAPQRSFAERVTESRASEPDQGPAR